MAQSVEYIIQLRDRFSRTLDKFNRKMSGVKKKTREATKSMSDFGFTTKRVLLGLGALATTSIITFARISQGLGNIKGLLTDLEFDTFGDEIESAQKEALKLGFKIDDVNKALFDNISALGASEKSIQVFNVAQKLAIAGNASLGVSVDGITSIVNAYGKDITDATEVANAFFSAQVKGKTTVAKLAANIGQVASIANTAGVGFKELLATISALTLGGLSTEESVTSLKGAINLLLSPTKEAGQILTALKVPFGVTQVRAVGLKKAFEKLTAAGEKYPDLIARAIPNVRAFTAVTSLSADKLKIIDEILTKINQDTANGTGLNKVYTDQLAQMAKQLSITKGSFTILFNAIGAGLAPSLLPVLKFIQAINTGLAKIIELGKIEFGHAGFGSGDNSLKQPVSQSTNVDVGGLIKVAAEPGTRVTQAKTFNPDVGLNVAFAR